MNPGGPEGPGGPGGPRHSGPSQGPLSLRGKLLLGGSDIRDGVDVSSVPSLGAKAKLELPQSFAGRPLCPGGP